MHQYEAEPLSQYLALIFGWDKLLKAYKKYRVGTVKRWGGRAIVFWQIDTQNRIRFGKVMGYDDGGHRIKNRVNSAHNILSKLNRVRKDYNTKMCFFGEHLLNKSDPGEVVNLVESEKTALFCHIKFGGLWLATSQMHGISLDRCRALQGRDIIMWPDLGRGVQAWIKKRWIVGKFARSVRVALIFKYLKIKMGEGQWESMVKKWWNSSIDGADLMDFYDW